MRRSVSVVGTISEGVGFRGAFVKWEKETALKWKTCQSKRPAMGSRWVRCREEIRSRKIHGFCARTHPEGSSEGPGKCRTGADQSQGHSLIATLSAASRVPWNGRDPKDTQP